MITRKPTDARSEDEEEAKCRQARARLLASSDDRLLPLELLQTQECPDTGPELLASRWKKVPNDTARIEVPSGVSRRIIDARIAEAALEVVQNRAAPLRVRVLALEALVGQFGIQKQATPTTGGGKPISAMSTEVENADLFHKRLQVIKGGQ